MTATLSSSTQRQRRKDARPLELLDAALDLFVEKGFTAARAEEVAQRAGVSKGTLYLYYPSKEELFKAVITRNLTSRIADTAQQVQAWQGEMAPLLQSLLVQWWQETYASPASGVFKILVSEMRNFPEIAEYYVQQVIEPGSALIGSIVARGIAQRRVPCGRCREHGAFAGAADGDAVRAQARPVGLHATPDRRPAFHRRACGPGRARLAPAPRLESRPLQKMHRDEHRTSPAST